MSDMPTYNRIAPDVRLGRNVRIFGFANLYGCTLGDDTRVGAFVEIQKNAIVGAQCKISSHTFICEGVTIEDEVFIGHGVMFINDLDPRATSGGQLQTEADWEVIPTRVCRGASIGSGAVILAGVTIGAGALVGAGAVVTHDVAPNTIVVGNPARFLRMRNPIGDETNAEQWDHQRDAAHTDAYALHAAAGTGPARTV
jgi:acetyltransferase-like isoleucine patch superfamily enzyme